jgi:8-oxo-dGTP pyrophosphatase MutT (NUDIX family)
VPAGGIAAGESPSDAVRRELAEESGLIAAWLVRKLGESWFFASAGDVPRGYAFRWVHLDQAAACLHRSQPMWIAAVRNSLEHPPEP